MSNEVLLELNKLLFDDNRLFFENMGGLHDCSLKRIEVGINKKYLVIEIDDLYSNFIGLEEYIECKNINLIKIELSTLEYLTIDEINILNQHLNILFNNGDKIILQIDSKSLIKLEKGDSLES